MSRQVGYSGGLYLVLMVCLFTACASKTKIAMPPAQAEQAQALSIPIQPTLRAASNPSEAPRKTDVDPTNPTQPTESPNQAQLTSPKTEPRLVAKIEAGADVNPYFIRSEKRERPSPIVVRLYQLRSVGAFQNATFSSLFDNDQQTLGEAFLNREEVQLMPGETQPFERSLSPEARYIGVIAKFRQPERAQWRAHLAVDQLTTAELSVQIRGTNLSVNRH